MFKLKTASSNSCDKLVRPPYDSQWHNNRRIDGSPSSAWPPLDRKTFFAQEPDQEPKPPDNMTLRVVEQEMTNLWDDIYKLNKEVITRALRTRGETVDLAKLDKMPRNTLEALTRDIMGAPWELYQSRLDCPDFTNVGLLVGTDPEFNLRLFALSTVPSQPAEEGSTANPSSQPWTLNTQRDTSVFAAPPGPVRGSVVLATETHDGTNFTNLITKDLFNLLTRKRRDLNSHINALSDRLDGE